MRRAVTFMALLGAALVAPTGEVPAAERTQAPRAAPVRLAAHFECVSDRRASLSFTIENIGRRPLAIDQDFHLSLERVVAGGHEPITMLFVFPAPGFDVIPPSEQRTFMVPVDTDEAGALDGRRLILGADVFFEGRDRPATRHFSFSGCAA